MLIFENITHHFLVNLFHRKNGFRIKCVQDYA